MTTELRLFRYDRKLTACALGEPSLTLVRNDEQFGLLISAGAHEDSYTGRFFLDEVTYLWIAGTDWGYRDFDSVAIYEEGGVWLAQDLDSRRYFPNPSHRPYHVIFIAQEEYDEIQHARAEGVAYPVFEAAQQHFGRLPGFTFLENSLESPDDYANSADAVAQQDYVLAGEE